MEETSAVVRSPRTVNVEHIVKNLVGTSIEKHSQGTSASTLAA
jgi:hypothetical protein